MKGIISIIFRLIIGYICCFITWARVINSTIRQGDVGVTLLNNHNSVYIDSPSGRYSVIYAVDYQNPEVALAYLDYNEFGGSGRYKGKFKIFNAPPEVKVRHNWYKNSGYDRGHLISNDFFNFDKQLSKETFAVYNICPQTQSLNQGKNGNDAWRALEDATEKAYANAYGRVYVITGPILDKEPIYYKVLENTNCVIPEKFYKIILVQDLKDETYEFTRMEVYYFENRDLNKGEKIDLLDSKVYETTDVENHLNWVKTNLNLKLILY